jgi:hypothetical protein
MKFFTVKCHNCGEQNPLVVEGSMRGNDEMNSVRIFFYRETPKILARMVFYCRNCGNREEHMIHFTTSVGCETDVQQMCKRETPAPAPRNSHSDDWFYRVFFPWA